MLNVIINKEKIEIEEGTSLRQVLLNFSPYGEEATIIIQNGKYYKSIDITDDSILVNDNDVIEIVPLIIGG